MFHLANNIARYSTLVVDLITGKLDSLPKDRGSYFGEKAPYDSFHIAIFEREYGVASSDLVLKYTGDFISEGVIFNGNCIEKEIKALDYGSKASFTTVMQHMEIAKNLEKEEDYVTLITVKPNDSGLVVQVVIPTRSPIVACENHIKNAIVLVNVKQSEDGGWESPVTLEQAEQIARDIAVFKNGWATEKDDGYVFKQANMMQVPDVYKELVSSTQLLN